MPSATEGIAPLLDGLRLGDRAALDRLFGIVYEELHRQAHRQRARWNGDETFGTTVLVHEAYLKLVGQRRILAEDLPHFMAVAARAMRHILINHARGRRTRKRGGGVQQVSLQHLEREPATEARVWDSAEELLALDDALSALERADSRQARVVECRFFGGMSVEQTAAALSLSPRTVKRDWAVAQAWLRRRLDEADG
jgi:RNA polymerase sigma factor (TIGR02999 family)